jgi:hypothetical protein
LRTSVLETSDRFSNCLCVRAKLIAGRGDGDAGKHDMARAVRMAIEAEWDGHEVFFISNKDSRCLRPTREVLKKWYAVPLLAVWPC